MAKIEVNKAMEEWIVETTHHLGETSNSNNQLLSAVTLLCIITSLANKKDVQLDKLNEQICILLNLLVANVDLDSRTVPGYRILLSAIESTSRKHVSQCLWDVLLHRLKICGPLDPTWICVLPYNHFLNDLCQPFEKLPPNKAWKLYEGLNLGRMKYVLSRAQFKAEYVKM